MGTITRQVACDLHKHFFGGTMKRTALTALPVLLATLLLTGCGSTPAAPAAAPPAATGAATTEPAPEATTAGSAAPAPTAAPAPVLPPEMANPLVRLAYQDDSMSLYFQSDLTPEEKTTQLRIYRAIASGLNLDSPVYPEIMSATDKLYADGIISAGYRDLGRSLADWNPTQEARRKAGVSHQVTGVYCPMREQTLKTLDSLEAHCYFTGVYLQDGAPYHSGDWAPETGIKYNDPSAVHKITATLVKEDGIFKVDRLSLEKPYPTK